MQYEEAEEESQKYKARLSITPIVLQSFKFQALQPVTAATAETERSELCCAQVGKSILEAAKLKSRTFVSAPPRDWNTFSASLLQIESPDNK